MQLTLHTGRGVTIRTAAADDRTRLLEHYIRLSRDPEAVFFPLPQDPSAVERWLERSGYFDFGRNIHTLAIDGDGAVVADLFVRRTEMPSIGLSGIGQVYLAIARGYRDIGLGGQLLKLLRTYLRPALVDAGIRRLTGHVFPENHASLAIVFKAGFALEGVLRQHMRGADGRYHDMVVIGMMLVDAPCSGCALHADTVRARWAVAQGK
jgi:RimJ/RimL family protein N-acetyltransferase